jgi:hypothetical protein
MSVYSGAAKRKTGGPTILNAANPGSKPSGLVEEIAAKKLH